MTPTMIEDVTSRVQRGFLTVADDLQRIERKLSMLVDGLDLENEALAQELASTAEAVRRDLLHDAIDTLMSLGYQTAEGAIQRQRSVYAARETVMSAASAGSCP